MRLIDYGRNHKKRKEYIHQSGLLLAGVDVSKAKHDAGALLRYAAGIFAGLPSDQLSYRDLIY